VSTVIAWQSFYIIIGSAAGALTGLTFVVVTLMQRRQAQGVGSVVAAYTTPTIVHLGAALLVCAVLSAPWPALALAAVLLGLTGLAGTVYVGVVVRRIRRVGTTYEPVIEDWVWRGILPLVAYVALLIAAPVLLLGSATLALFGVGAALVLLLLIGIHNAWDEVTFIAVELPQRSDGSQPQRQPAGKR
jgi:hypothetical protein